MASPRVPPMANRRSSPFVPAPGSQLARWEEAIAGLVEIGFDWAPPHQRLKPTFTLFNTECWKIQLPNARIGCRLALGPRSDVSIVRRLSISIAPTQKDSRHWCTRSYHFCASVGKLKHQPLPANRPGSPATAAGRLLRDLRRRRSARPAGRRPEHHWPRLSPFSVLWCNKWCNQNSPLL